MLFSLSNASFLTKDHLVFENLDWEVREGEHWVIRGDNGSGKTTLLECLAGRRTLTRGSLTYRFVDGQTWDEKHQQKKQHIRYVPSRVFMSVFKSSSAFFYQQRYYASGNEEVRTVADFLRPEEQAAPLPLPPSLNLGHLLPLPVTYLSNGQLRKLVLLKALQSSPSLLLLDYPYEGLDVASREEFNRFITQLLALYPTTLILTDNRHELPASISRTFTLAGTRRAAPAVVLPSGPGLLAAPPPAAKDIISLRQVNIRYGEKVLFADFSWTVKAGERWALVGKNGSGKSTLLSLIFADHPQAYANEVYLFGRRRGSGESIWDIKRQINFMAPEISTYFHYSVRQNETVAEHLVQEVADAFTGRPPGGTQRQERSLAHLGYFGMAHLAPRTVRSLSSGEAQLVFLIKAFLREKPLYLLDEPFQYLDPLHTELASRFVEEHLPPEATLILITHYPESLPPYVQQVKYLGEGKRE
ncbi:ATP-binding cassette domain-containing protein [soil metagenome]